MSEQPTDSSKPIDLACPTAPKHSQTQLDAERMNRRSALRKFGFGAGLAALFALSGDDLARMASAKLKRISGDNTVASKIAAEFQNAGIAFAGPSGCDDSFSCQACCIKLCAQLEQCSVDYDKCRLSIERATCEFKYRDCKAGKRDAYGTCVCKKTCTGCNCKDGSPCPDPAKPC